MGILKCILYFSVLFTFFSCDEKREENIPDRVVISSTSFSLNDQTDDDNPINFSIEFSGAIQALKIYDDETCTSEIEDLSISNNSSVNVNLTLSTQQLYNFYISYSDSPLGRLTECVNLNLVYNYYVPSVDESYTLSMTNPLSGTISTDDTPEFSMTGTDRTDGDLLKIYNDDSCLSEIGRSSFLSGDSTVTSLSLSVGMQSFYYRISNSDESVNGDCTFSGNYYTLEDIEDTYVLNMISPTSQSTSTDNTVDFTMTGTQRADTDLLKIYTDITCTTEVGRGIFSSGNSSVTTNALSVGLNSFYYRLSNSDESINGSCVFSQRYYTLEDIEESYVLTMVSPANQSNSNDATVDFTMTGTSRIDGDLLKIYTDNTCATEIGRGIFTSGNALVTTNTLSDGLNSFYYRLSNSDESINGSCVFSNNYYTLNSDTPLITGLENDGTSRQTKTFNWSCNKTACTYRYLINNISNTNPTGSYGSGTTYTDITGNTGTYYLHIQAIDDLGNESSVYHYSYILDNTSPNDPTATVSFLTPIESSDANQIPVSWGASSSGDVSGYEISLVTTSGDPDSSVTGWINVGNVTSASFSASATLGLSECTIYYFMVRAYDSAGNYSGNTDSSNSFYFDQTIPDQANLSSLIGDDSSKYLTNTFEIDGASDNCGNTLNYTVSIGTSLGGEEISSYQSVGTTTTNQLQNGVGGFNFELETKTNYYINIKTVDTAGNESSVQNLGPFDIPLPTWSTGWVEYDWTGDDTVLENLIPDFTKIGVQFGNNSYPVTINNFSFESSHPTLGDNVSGDSNEANGDNYYIEEFGYVTGNNLYTGKDAVADPGGVNANNLSAGYISNDFMVNLIGLDSSAEYFIYLAHYGCTGQQVTYSPDDGGSNETYTNSLGNQKILRYGFVSSASGTFQLDKTNALLNDGCVHGFWVVEAE